MGSILHERVDFRPKFMPKTIAGFLNELSTICNVSEKSSKLNDYIKSLEDEMRKIDAFKRELPLCMLLLKDAILYLNDESVQCTTANVEPVLEEFIPLKKDDCNEEMNEADKKEDCRDKKNWMSSVQLWNSDDHSAISSEHNSKVETKKVVEEVDRSAGENPFQTCKGREEGKTFIPFKGYPTFLSKVVARREDKKDLSVPALSLLTPGIKNSKEESGSSHSKPSCSRLGSFSISKVQSNLRTGPQQPQHQQTNRKQRRCWSPELHRRFVNSLQQLGGSQAATPKQIRELMQVDGLTNDEVKSHLQKYRLHSRRHPTATPATLTNQSAVVMGGLWTPRDQYVESSKQSNSQSGSPEGPLQLAGNTGGTTITGDYSMEDDDEDEDEKSESYSWRSHIHKPRKGDV